MICLEILKNHANIPSSIGCPNYRNTACFIFDCNLQPSLACFTWLLQFAHFAAHLIDRFTYRHLVNRKRSPTTHRTPFGHRTALAVTQNAKIWLVRELRVGISIIFETSKKVALFVSTNPPLRFAFWQHPSPARPTAFWQHSFTRTLDCLFFNGR
jgi:hypothetical protein